MHDYLSLKSAVKFHQRITKIDYALINLLKRGKDSVLHAVFYKLI